MIAYGMACGARWLTRLAGWTIAKAPPNKKGFANLTPEIFSHQGIKKLLKKF